MALTKLDVLDGFDTLKICTGYDCDGQVLDYFPSNAAEQAACTPIYEEMPGWAEALMVRGHGQICLPMR